TQLEKIRDDLKNNSHNAIKMVQENDCRIDSFSNEATTLVENMRVDMERLASGKFEVNNDDAISEMADMPVENRPESSASVLTEINGDCRKRTRSQMPIRKKRHK
ncbi:5964_t:CDS:2, partial [Paraglomus occultum]